MAETGTFKVPPDLGYVVEWGPEAARKFSSIPASLEAVLEGRLDAANLPVSVIPLVLRTTDPDASRALAGAPDAPAEGEEPLDKLVEEGPDTPPAPAAGGTPDPSASPGVPAPEERCPCEGPHQPPYAPNDEGLCFTHRDGCGGARSCACSANTLQTAEARHSGPLVDQGGGVFRCQKHASQGCP